ncbi:MAG: SAM-dependent methyltransferase [Marinosulfonomonas sp.]|nr:SAM-dependent methyltransferase [Marinosulfonomonas sp.]
MQKPPDLTDRTALLRNRARALAMDEPAMFLQQLAAVEIQERLNLVNRTFTAPAIISPFPEIWADVAHKAPIVPDDDILTLKPGTHDLVIHALSLHWANDIVGQLVQARRALKPDGLFLAVLFGGQTLHELRAALAQSESQITGGLSPRIAPMAEIRDLGGLLQRAGFALPVADSLTQNVTYKSMTHLMRDLRAMGEGNALATRRRQPIQRDIFTHASKVYQKTFSDPNGIRATFEMVFLTGWAPADSQQKPLRPGSAQRRLADALDTTEIDPSSGTND